MAREKQWKRIARHDLSDGAYGFWPSDRLRDPRIAAHFAWRNLRCGFERRLLEWREIADVDDALVNVPCLEKFIEEFSQPRWSITRDDGAVQAVLDILTHRFGWLSAVEPDERDAR